MTKSASFCNPIYNYAVLVPLGIFFMVPIVFIVWVYYNVHKVMVSTTNNVKMKKKEADSKSKTCSERVKSMCRFDLKSVMRKISSFKLAMPLGLSSRGISGDSDAPLASSGRRFSRPKGKKKPEMSEQERREKKARKKQMAVTRLMIIMCLSILFCWMPLYVYMTNVMIKVFTGERTFLYETSEMALGIGAALSSLCSPAIYGSMNTKISQAMHFAFLPASWKKRFEESQYGNQVPTGALFRRMTKALNPRKSKESNQVTPYVPPPKLPKSSQSSAESVSSSSTGSSTTAAGARR